MNGRSRKKLFQATHGHLSEKKRKGVGAASSRDHPIASRLEAAPTDNRP